MSLLNMFARGFADSWRETPRWVVWLSGFSCGVVSQFALKLI